MKPLMVAILFATATGCTDAGWSRLTALGDSASIKCYSGGVLIFEGRSTGKVKSEQSSDGYFFKDAADGLLKEVSGNCVIGYGG